MSTKGIEKLVGYAVIGATSAVLGIVQQIFTEKDVASEVSEQLKGALKNGDE